MVMKKKYVAPKVEVIRLEESFIMGLGKGFSIKEKEYPWNSKAVIPFPENWNV